MDNQTTKHQRLLTAAQAAEYLGLSKSTLAHQRKTGPLDGHIRFVPYIKLGRNIRYDLDDLNKYIKVNRVVGY